MVSFDWDYSIVNVKMNYILIVYAAPGTCRKAAIFLAHPFASAGGGYSKRQIYLPFTIAASGGCERARKVISRFAARARRGVNVQNEIRFDVYDSLDAKLVL